MSHPPSHSKAAPSPGRPQETASDPGTTAATKTSTGHRDPLLCAVRSILAGVTGAERMPQQTRPPSTAGNRPPHAERIGGPRPHPARIAANRAPGHRPTATRRRRTHLGPRPPRPVTTPGTHTPAATGSAACPSPAPAVSAGTPTPCTAASTAPRRE